jgi:hypothetical protein
MKAMGAGAVIAAMAMYVWGFVFWSVLPQPQQVAGRAARDEATLRSALRDTLPEAGVYFVPHFDPEDTDGFAQRHQEGPLATIHFQPTGQPPLRLAVLASGFLHFFVCALGMGALLRLFAGARGYALRAFFVAAVGLLGAVSAHLAAPIWFLQPWPFHLLNTVYMAGEWIIAGLVLAAFVKSPATLPTEG